MKIKFFGFWTYFILGAALIYAGGCGKGGSNKSGSSSITTTIIGGGGGTKSIGGGGTTPGGDEGGGSDSGNVNGGGSTGGSSTGETQSEWNTPLPGQQVTNVNGINIPMVRVNVCAIVTDDRRHDGLRLNMMVDYLPPHYFRRWANASVGMNYVGWTGVGKIPVILKAVILGEDGEKEYVGNVDHTISGPDRENPPNTNSYLEVWNQPMSAHRHGLSELDPSSGTAWSTSERLTYGHGFRLADPSSYQEYSNYKFVMDTNGNFQEIRKSDPIIKKITLDIPIMHNNSSWYFFHMIIQGQDIEVHTSKKLSDSDFFDPHGGCYENFPISAQQTYPTTWADVGQLTSFNPTGHPLGWWGTNFWVIPEY